MQSADNYHKKLEAYISCEGHKFLAIMTSVYAMRSTVHSCDKVKVNTLLHRLAEKAKHWFLQIKQIAGHRVKIIDIVMMYITFEEVAELAR